MTALSDDDDSETLPEKSFWWRNRLSLACMISWVASVITGITMINIRKYGQRNIIAVGLIGDLYSRSLKCLGMPLIMLSIITSLAKIEFQHALQYFVCNIMVFLMSTLLATANGALFAYMIAPGRNVTEKQYEPAAVMILQDAILDIIRDFVTDNIVSCAVYSHQTVLIKPEKTEQNVTDISGSKVISISKHSWDFKSNPRSPGSNFKGLIVVSIVAGMCLSYKSRHHRFIFLLEKFLALFETCLKPVMYVAPVGIFFSQVANIMQVDVDTLGEVFWLALTLTITVATCCLIIYPIMYVLALKRSPFLMMFTTLPVAINACATRSSYATFPVSLHYLKQHYKLSAISSGLTIPIGCFFHMPGASSMIIVEVLYLSQIGEAKILGLQKILELMALSVLTTVTVRPVAGFSVTSWVNIIAGLLKLSVQTGDYLNDVDVIADTVATILNVVADMYSSVLVDKVMEKRIASDKRLSTFAFAED